MRILCILVLSIIVTNCSNDDSAYYYRYRSTVQDDLNNLAGWEAQLTNEANHAPSKKTAEVSEAKICTDLLETSKTDFGFNTSKLRVVNSSKYSMRELKNKIASCYETLSKNGDRMILRKLETIFGTINAINKKNLQPSELLKSLPKKQKSLLITR